MGKRLLRRESSFWWSGLSWVMIELILATLWGNLRPENRARTLSLVPKEDKCFRYLRVECSVA
jgi:hypothetical protein